MPAIEARAYLCWGCKAVLRLAYVFCPHCVLIQPPISIDPFTRLGLAARFDINQDVLDKAYSATMQALHPDRFVTKSARERLFAQQHAAAASQAYSVLKNIHERALALLHLRQIDEKDLPAVDTTTLQEAFLLREQLATLMEDVQCKDFQTLVQDKLDACYKAVASAFAGNEEREAWRHLQRFQYLSKLIQELKERTLFSSETRYH